MTKSETLGGRYCTVKINWDLQCFKKNSKIVSLVRTECINEYFLKITKISETKFFISIFFQCFAKFEKKSSKNL